MTSSPHWLAWLETIVLLVASTLAGAAEERVPATQPAGNIQSQSNTMRIYIGTYTGGKSKGIYELQLDASTGALSTPELVAQVLHPTFLAAHPNGRFLYSTNEADTFAGQKNTGGVSAFAVDPGSGKLTLLNQQPSGGGWPCHVAVAPDGKHLLAVNYAGGNLAAFPIGEDGRLGERSGLAQHAGKGVNPQRQEAPHAHCAAFDPAGHFAFACDLGLDKVMAYRLDGATGALVANDPAFAAVPPGSGPRHVVFHPTGRFMYVISELSNAITAFTYDADRGAASAIQNISTLPDGVTGKEGAAEIAVHPSGRFLYGSNRANDTIAIFSIDPQTGRLTAAGHQPSQGKNPRCFAIDPSGTWLVAANQNSDNLVVFKIDSQTGQLAPTGTIAKVPSGCCVLFVPAAR